MARAAASANPAAEVARPDGRVELADPAGVAESRYANPALVPVPVAQRTWSTYNYTALWVGMSHNLPTYALAAGLIALGSPALGDRRLLANPHIYIFVWLGFYGGLLGAVAGVLVAGYWIINRTQLDLAALYQAGGRYWYAAGWNWRAVVATVVGPVLAVGGAWSAPGQGPFPAGGLIPFLKPLYDYSWVVGFAAAFLVYLITTMVVPPSRGARSGRNRQGRTDPAAVDG